MVVFLFTSMAVSAQEYWTLEDCIDYALEKNIRLKRQELQVEHGKYNYRQSWLDVLPGISAGGSHTYSRGRSLDMITYEYIDIPHGSGNVSMSANMDLFNGFYNRHNIRRQYYNLQAGLYEVEGARDDISLNIVAVFLQILYEKELLEIDKQQLELSNMQVENARLSYELGDVPKRRLYELQSENAAIRHRVTLSGNRVKSAYLELKQMLQLDMEVDFRVKGPEMNAETDASVLLNPVEAIYDEAHNRVPQVRSAEYLLKSSERSLAASRSFLYPTLSVSAGLGSRYSELARDPRQNNSSNDYPYDLQLRDNYGQYLAVSVSIPIFNRWQARTRINRARTDLLDAEYRLEEIKQNLYSQVHQQYNDAEAARDNFESAEKAGVFAREAFNHAKREFELGLISFVDFRHAQNNYISAESELARARYDLMLRLVFLDYFMGKPISLE